jgi:hypothetical protein
VCNCSECAASLDSGTSGVVARISLPPGATTSATSCSMVVVQRAAFGDARVILNWSDFRSCRSEHVTRFVSSVFESRWGRFPNETKSASVTAAKSASRLPSGSGSARSSSRQGTSPGRPRGDQLRRRATREAWRGWSGVARDQLDDDRQLLMLASKDRARRVSSRAVAVPRSQRAQPRRARLWGHSSSS